MNVITDTPTKISGDRLEMCCDSDLKIETSGKNFFLQTLKDNILLIATLTGVFCGFLAGIILRNFGLTEEGILIVSYPGEIFMRILKLIILPLVVSSLISCTASLNAKINGKIAVKTLAYFVLTSLFNSFLGVLLAVIIHPGSDDARLGGSDPEIEAREVNILDSFLDIGRNMFPDNIFQAFFQQTHTVYVPVKKYMMNGSLLNDSMAPHSDSISIRMTRTLRPRDGSNNIGIITFCLVFGTTLGTIQTSSSETVVSFFRCIYEVVMKIMTGIMWLTPIGICSVICGKILSVNDLSVVIAQLGWFVFTVVLGLAVYQLIALQLLYFVIIKRNPFKFYFGLIPAMLTAFATASTAAALPVTFQCMDEKVKIDQRISRFVLPIGCSINMDGTALFLSSATIFISQMNAMTLSSGDIITVGLVSTAASMSSASVPSAALVLMLMILTSIGCPVEDVSLLFAVDWLVDRCRTVNNMLGDCYASAVVEHYSKGELSNAETMVLHRPL